MRTNLHSICFLTAGLTLFSSCMPGSGVKTNADSGVFSIDTILAEGDAVRMGLVEENNFKFGEKTLNSLLSSKIIVPEKPDNGLALTREVFEGVQFGGRYAGGVKPGSDGTTVKNELFSINGELSNIKIGDGTGKQGFVLPGRLTAGRQIHVARTFPNEAAAGKALPYNLLALPLSAEKAKAMAAGDYVGIPVTMRFGMQASGSFLSKSASWAKELGKFVNLSAAGSLSGSKQGELIVEGNVRLHVIRMTGNRVRVRLSQDQGVSANGSATISAGSNLKALFVPATKLEKIRSLKTLPGLPKATKLADLGQKAQSFVALKIPPAMAVLSAIPGPTPKFVSDQQELVKLAAGRLDDAVAIVDSVNDKIEDINAKLTGRVNKAITGFNSKFIDKPNELIEKAKAFSDRSLNLAASVEIGGSFAKKMRMMADYIFDLDNKEAAEAFERMVSGRVVMMTASTAKSPWSMSPETAYGDVTMAERLAIEDFGKSSRRVQRMAQMQDDMQEKGWRVAFGAPTVSLGFAEKWKQNKISMAADDGAKQNFFLALWNFVQTSKWFGRDLSEAKSSGFLLPVTEAFNTGVSNGAYFFGLQVVDANSQQQGVEQSLAKALNVLGPVAFRSGLPKIYMGEFPGHLETQIQAVILPGAVARFFDPKQATPARLWKALGNMASTFNNEFGLMQLASPARDWQSNAALKDSKGVLTPLGIVVQDNCEKVAKAWGGGYCNNFYKTFLPRLYALQANNDFMARMKFFEDYYTDGFFMNKNGADVMIRYVCEVLSVIAAETGGGSLSASDFYLKVAVKNRDNQSLPANPTLEFGSDPTKFVTQALTIDL